VAAAAKPAGKSAPRPAAPAKSATAPSRSASVAPQPVASSPSKPVASKPAVASRAAPVRPAASGQPVQASRRPIAPAAVALAPGAGAKPAKAPSSANGGAPGAGAKPASVAGTSFEEQVNYQYNTLGRRDPFQSMIEGEFVGADVGGNAPPDVGGMQVVGIIWGDADKFAMVEDGRGNSHVLRRGDKVMNGVVTGLKRDGVTFTLTTDDGQSQTVTVPLNRKGEKNASR
jgi:hypothetical protein